MKLKFYLLPLSFAALVACSDTETETPEPVDDAGTNVTDDMGTTPDAAADMADAGGIDPHAPGLALTPAQDGVTADGNGDVEVALTDEARAGRILGDTGFHGLWAHCRQGDFRLYNDEIEVCIQAETTNRMEMFTGGALVDARVYGSTAEDIFDLHKTRFGLNVQFAESVGVVRDGSDGGPAVVRVEGKDSPVAYLVGVAGGLFRSDGLSVTTEYRLWPGARDVEIVTWINNPNELNKSGVIGEFYSPGDRTRQFREGVGLVDKDSSEFAWLASFGEGASFGWLAERSTKIDEIPTSSATPWLFINAGTELIKSGEPFAWRRWLAVGDGSVDSIREIQATRLGVELGPLQTLTLSHGEGPIAGRLVEIWDGETPITAGHTDENGAFAFHAAPKTYTVRVAPIMGGDPTEETIAFDGTGELAISTPAKLTVNVTEDGNPRTALVRVHGDANDEFFAVGGQGKIELAPGTYNLVITRGMEYDVIVRQITVESADDHVEDVNLVRSVDTTGWIAADFHQHMEPSSDSAIDVRTRIIDNVAEGVEFVAATDHDVVTDLQPWIDELGLENELATYAGVEISPVVSHMGLYPMPFDKTKRGNGTLTLAELDENGDHVTSVVPELIARARQISTSPIVQLNHPRGASSLFETVDFDPTQHPADVQHRHWSTDFDVMEIVNRIASTCDIMADWSTFLNTGYQVTGLGNSDTHRVKRGNAPGVPRNYLHIDQEPGSITHEAVRTALMNGNVSVSAHAFISFADGKVPGDTISTSTTAPVDFDLRVQTPEFSEITRVHVVVNGQVVESLDASATNGFDFAQVIQRTFDKDSWILFVAVGPNTQTLSDYGGPTFAFTNPIFIDVDGDTDTDGNAFEAPGLLPVDLSPINETGWCD